MNKIIWKSEKRKVDELTPFPGNPRKADEKQISDIDTSLERFSLADPLVINTDNTVIGGNLRLSRLMAKGVKEVDVRVPSRKLILKEAQELNLRLNKNVGSWDFGELANFSEEMLLDAGWSGNELDEIFGLEKADDFNEQEEFDKAIKNPRGVKEGDIWQLGDHKLIIGDSTNKENWKRLLGEEKFDFMFTDPPYRLAYCRKRVRKVHTKEGWKIKKEREYSSVGETNKEGRVKGFGSKQNRAYDGIMKRGVPEFDEWLSIANEYQNPKGANVMIFENWKNVHDLWEAIEKYWRIRNMVIWHLPNRHQGFSAKYQFYSRYDIAPLADKGKAIMNEDTEQELEDYLEEKGQKLLDSYEIIIYGNKEKSEWNRQPGKWGKICDHISWVSSTESSTQQNLIFGTKPIQILVPYIKILSPREGIVMEPFAGSGSTILACEIMKRKCRAIEISPTYAEVILNRFERFSGKKAEKTGEAKL